METTSTTPIRRQRRLSRMLVALVAAIVATVGLGLTSTAPAHAATGVTYCFVQTNGAPLYLENTSLYAYTTSGWSLIAYGRTSANGCGSFYTPGYSNYYLKVKAGTFTSRLRGETPRIAVPGSGNAHLGTGVAWLSWT